jgi:ADP-heptose:LPS heptosyltransferase
MNEINTLWNTFCERVDRQLGDGIVKGENPDANTIEILYKGEAHYFAWIPNIALVMLVPKSTSKIKKHIRLVYRQKTMRPNRY